MMKSILLVHGAWHGAWCWNLVEKELKNKGVDVRSLNLPFTGVNDDIASVSNVLEDIDNQVILLGHSYGGIVISSAAEAKQNVDQLIYLSAILLEPGESMQLDGSKIQIDVDENLMSEVKESSAIPAFYGDVDPKLAKASIELLRPFPIVSGSQGIGEAWREKHSTYIVCREDKAIPPELQYVMAKKADRIIEWECGHSPFLSKPKLVIDLLLNLASSTD
ncbi:MAG: alpha/beta hydrolase [Actinomycetota bacterium]|nr:alpha/beta hydrolase [Actinomycetota bacterium]